jgi:hypothetical protein
MLKVIYGVELEVITDTVIEGDFGNPNTGYYFENDVTIKGNLNCKFYFAVKSITVEENEEVGEWQEVEGTITCGLKIFAGVCNWRNISDDEKTITCEKLISGNIVHGILKEIPRQSDNKIELL